MLAATEPFLDSRLGVALVTILIAVISQIVASVLNRRHYARTRRDQLEDREAERQRALLDRVLDDHRNSLLAVTRLVVAVNAPGPLGPDEPAIEALVMELLGISTNSAAGLVPSQDSQLKAAAAAVSTAIARLCRAIGSGNSENVTSAARVCSDAHTALFQHIGFRYGDMASR